MWVQLMRQKFCSPFALCSTGIGASPHVTILLLVSGLIFTYAPPTHDSGGK